jgi:hypothetical protein
VQTFTRLLVGYVAVFLLTLQLGCSDSTTSASSTMSGEPRTTDGKLDCGSLEPQNPYDDESGHDAGYKWAVEHDPASCSGNSSSFEEGCEEYLRQVAAFQACQNKQ